MMDPKIIELVSYFKLPKNLSVTFGFGSENFRHGILGAFGHTPKTPNTATRVLAMEGLSESLK
jgi:hypothetical protein